MWNAKTVIWKSPLKLTHSQEISVPKGAEFLCAREQYGDIAVWYRCNPDADKVIKTVTIYGTGHDASPKGEYLDTILLSNGRLVLHVFVD